MAQAISIAQHELLESAPEHVEFRLPKTGSVFAERKLSKSGNVWYEGSTSNEDGKKALIGLPGDTSHAALDALPTWEIGTEAGIVELNRGPVHISEPRKFGKDHAKAGQIMAGSGGNVTRTDSGSVEIKVGDTVVRYTVMATVTAIVDKDTKELKGYSVTCKLMPPPAPRQAKAVGYSEGFTTVAR